MSNETQSATKYAQDEYDTAKLRQMITQAFSEGKLTDFAFDHFRDIYEQFSDGMKKALKISLLIEGCYRRNKLDELPDLSARYRPGMTGTGLLDKKAKRASG